MKFNSSPSMDGYVLMADYDHTATLILFPFRKDVWSDVEKAQRSITSWCMTVQTAI